MNNVTSFSLSDIKAAPPITDWQDFKHEGQCFLNTASAAHDKSKKVFTAEILYNIIAMAIEKFVMAALMHHGALPYNHTMRDLVEAMDETFPSALDELRDDLLRLDSYQEICDVDEFNITPPAMEEIPGMLKIAQRLEELVNKKLLHMAVKSDQKYEKQNNRECKCPAFP